MKSENIGKKDLKNVRGGFNPVYWVVDEKLKGGTLYTAVRCDDVPPPNMFPICTEPLNWPQDCKW